MDEKLNKKLFATAKIYLAGGVSSPVRSFKAVGGEPVFIKKAAGSKIYSQDGREFIDYCLSFGAVILGHSHPRIVEAAKRAVERGSTFGAVTVQEAELAGIIQAAIPSIEKLRLTNSGTEAVMGALRLSRACAKKDKIIRFQGSYHGSADYLLTCPGVPEDFRKHTLTCPYNDIEKFKALVTEYKGDVAAVIIEPVPANSGMVLPQESFLRGVREITRENNILLVFDEVITGFRLTFGGAQKLFNIKPDLTCLGKIIGGGFPVGAFGGRAKIMRMLAPEGKVYQAGTFSGNPVTVNAGIAALKALSEENPYKKLEKKTGLLCDNIGHLARAGGVRLKISHIGPIFGLGFSPEGLFKDFYQALLKEGVYLSPSPQEVDFISAAHTDRDIEKSLEAVERALGKINPVRNIAMR